MLAKLRSDYPYHWQNIEVSNQDMKYPYRRARTVRLRPWAAVCAISTLRVKAKNVFLAYFALQPDASLFAAGPISG